MASRRNIAFSLALLLPLAAVAALPQLGRSKIVDAFSHLAGARPEWLWIAAAAFVAGIFSAASSWRAVIGSCGPRLGVLDAASRYAVGGLVNTFVPARLGDAVRVGLFAKVLGDRDRICRAAGVYAAVGAARAVWVAVLLVAAAASGLVPLWPVFALAGGAALVGVAAPLFARGRFARLLDAPRELARSPRAAARVLLWAAAQTGTRVLAAAAISGALGLSNPFGAALLIVTALEVSGLLPLTPGNVGITSGAIAVALHTRGIGMSAALSTGIAFHGVETVASLAFGGAGAVYLAGVSSPVVRRVALGLGAGVVCASAAAFSAAILELF